MNAEKNNKIKKPSNSSTFLVKIVFTQNASIQGYVQWIEKKKTLPFRSCLELFHLMQNGVQSADQETASKVELRSWD